MEAHRNAAIFIVRPATHRLQHKEPREVNSARHRARDACLHGCCVSTLPIACIVDQWNRGSCSLLLFAHTNDLHRAVGREGEIEFVGLAAQKRSTISVAEWLCRILNRTVERCCFATLYCSSEGASQEGVVQGRTSSVVQEVRRRLRRAVCVGLTAMPLLRSSAISACKYPGARALCALTPGYFMSRLRRYSQAMRYPESTVHGVSASMRYLESTVHWCECKRATSASRSTFPSARYLLRSSGRRPLRAN